MLDLKFTLFTTPVQQSGVSQGYRTTESCFMILPTNTFPLPGSSKFARAPPCTAKNHINQKHLGSSRIMESFGLERTLKMF